MSTRGSGVPAGGGGVGVPEPGGGGGDWSPPPGGGGGGGGGGGAPAGWWRWLWLWLWLRRRAGRRRRRDDRVAARVAVDQRWDRRAREQPTKRGRVCPRAGSTGGCRARRGLRVTRIAATHRGHELAKRLCVRIARSGVVLVGE